MWKHKQKHFILGRVCVTSTEPRIRDGHSATHFLLFLQAYAILTLLFMAAALPSLLMIA